MTANKKIVKKVAAPSKRAKAAAKPAAKPVTKAVAKPAPKPVAKPVAKPAPKPAAPAPAPRPVVRSVLPKGGKNRGASSAAAILGQPMGKPRVFGNTHVKHEWQRYYENLLELRQRLLEQMSGLAKESAEEMTNYSLHMADQGTDNFDRDFALSLLSSDQDAIFEIEEALKRIEKNTYGVCELTGKAIPKARLEAIPWTRFTVEAQAQLERDGAIRTRRIGALGTIDGVGGGDIEEPDDDADEKPAKEKE